MSHLTRYPNHFYQPTPVNGSTPEPEARSDPEERPSPEASLSPTPAPMHPPREATSTPVSAHGLTAPGVYRGVR